MAYETKEEILNNIKDDIISARFLKRNTYEILYKNGNRAIRYHHTDIVTFKNNGDIVLNTNGWETSSTRERINEYSPFYIIQKDYIWYVFKNISEINYEPKAPNFNGIKYYDGIILKGQELEMSEILYKNRNGRYYYYHNRIWIT